MKINLNAILKFLECHSMYHRDLWVGHSDRAKDCNSEEARVAYERLANSEFDRFSMINELMNALRVHAPILANKD